MEEDQLIKYIFSIIQNSPPVVIAAFILSLVANFIQIGTYFRDHRRIKTEATERQRLAKLVDSYEDVLQIAKETIEDREQLDKLKFEIREKSELASDLETRIQSLEQIAQRELVTRAIDFNLSILQNAYAEVGRLRNQYAGLGELPDISPKTKAVIASDIESTIQNPHELPREFTFRSSLLVLLVLLLPWPANLLFLPFLLRHIIFTVFDAIRFYPNQQVKEITVRYYSYGILFASLGVWKGFFNGIAGVGQTFLSVVWNAVDPAFDVLSFFFVLFFGIQHWRELRNDIRDSVLPVLSRQLDS